MIEVKNLHKSFDGTKVLKGISTYLKPEKQTSSLDKVVLEKQFY